MPSQTEENYLKALFRLAKDQQEVSLSDLSSQLNVSAPTANSMIKKLYAKKLVTYQKYKPIKLTHKGQKAAALVIRKHRLTEMFLVKIMGFGWEEVHEIAEQIEHINSTLLFDRMDILLEHPTIDPHGSPIPDKNGHIDWKPYEKLGDCLPGQFVKLVALHQSSADFLKFLNSRGLALGMVIQIDSVESFDGSMMVSYGNNKKETLSALVCKNLLVEKAMK